MIKINMQGSDLTRISDALSPDAIAWLDGECKIALTNIPVTLANMQLELHSEVKIKSLTLQLDCQLVNDSIQLEVTPKPC